MDKNQYKELVAEYMRREAKLKEENTKLRIALCNLRDEYLDLCFQLPQVIDSS